MKIPDLQMLAHWLEPPDGETGNSPTEKKNGSGAVSWQYCKLCG
ncbi:hypothetical protein D1AOALGA4SA_13029 [Olavius algarvensis Delta 1 endosymbiont]|nr:hypothetical protein D1AOALGA4SA_13029 [Olavius algarvensis Delta 1 endosymbiont]